MKNFNTIYTVLILFIIIKLFDYILYYYGFGLYTNSYNRKAERRQQERQQITKFFSQL